MEEYVIGGVIGAVISYFFTRGLDLFIVRIKRKRENKCRKKAAGALDNHFMQRDPGYFPIDHAVPQYEMSNVQLKNIKKRLFIPIPQKYLKDLEELNFHFREGKDDASLLYECFQRIGIENYSLIIKQTASQVAEQFISELKKGYVRFNGEMYGVHQIRLNRQGTQENASLQMDFYITDYFTYRVMGFIYKKYKDRFCINNVEDVNRINGFLASFGIGCFLIADDGDLRYFVLAHRSKNVIVDKDKLHFSMNEAFSVKDIDGVYDNPSFETCLFRGLKEELRIGEKYRKNVVKYGFLDLGIEMDRLECGISCYAKIQLDANLTVDTMKGLYLSAQDKELETKELIFVPDSEIANFVAQNENAFSVSCLTTLKCLLIRDVYERI